MDSVRVYFRVNQSVLSPKIGENATLMNSFIKRIDTLYAEGALKNIAISGYASPEGPMGLNDRLALHRCEAVATEIVKRTTISPALITIKPGGVAWADLRQLVEESAKFDIRKNDIIAIIDSAGLNSTERLLKLKQLDGGKTYRMLLADLFPQMRYAKAVAFFKRTLTPPPQPTHQR